MFSDPESFKGFIRDIARFNRLDAETAGQIAVKIGDTPEMDAAGLCVASLDDGREFHVCTERRQGRVDPWERSALETARLAEFTRVVETPDGRAIEFNDLQWPSPSRPEAHWVQRIVLRMGATSEEVEDARRSLLQRLDCFRTCTLCAQPNPVGWMLDESVCQSCGTSELGAVH